MIGETYRELTRQFVKIALAEERRLIARAKRGCEQSKNELVLRHVGFVIFRIHKKVFSGFMKQFEEDILSEAIPVLYQKVMTYNLRYYDKRGKFKPVKFISYIWKRIDGFILNFLKKELTRLKQLKDVLGADTDYEDRDVSYE